MEPTLKKYSDGTKVWFLNGYLHREDGPATIGPDGSQAWFLNGKYHREDGPAIIYPDGTQKWWLNGLYHREDGPAIIYSDGYQEWWLNGKDITENVTNWVKERNVDLNDMSEFDKMVLKTEIKMWK
jgi:hypothetical protein